MDTKLLINSDAENLIEEIGNGNDDAFQSLYNLYFNYLSAFVWRKSGGIINKEEIKDIIHDTWAQVYYNIKNPEAKGRYDPGRASFSTYLANIAKFKILKQIRYNYSLSGIGTTYDGEYEMPDIESIPDNAESDPENRVIESEQKKLRQNSYLELIKVVLLCGGYPHQQFAFIISKLINGKQSSRTVEGKLDPIYTQYSELPFSLLSNVIKDWIGANNDIDESVKRHMLRSMSPVDDRLYLKLGELMALDKPSRDFFSNMLDHFLKDSCFKDYYIVSRDESKTKSASEISNTISNWILKLEDRVRKVLGADGDERPAISDIKDSCRDCKFRKLPPCEKNSN